MSIREMQREIDHYHVPKVIANAMMALAKIGYKPSGHGCGMGSEDWSVYKSFGKDSIGVYFSWNGHSTEASFTLYVGDKDFQSSTKKPGWLVKDVSKIKSKKDFAAAIKKYKLFAGW